MVLALLQKPDNGSDKLLKVSHTRADLTSFGMMVLNLGPKENPRTSPFDYTEQGCKRLVH